MSAPVYHDPAIKWISGALVLFALVVGFVGFQIIDLQTSRHTDADAARAHQDASIRQLACLFISQVPDDPKRPVIAQFREAYQCPAYSKARAKNPFAPLPPVKSSHAIPPATAVKEGIKSTISGREVIVGPGGTVITTSPAPAPAPVTTPAPQPTSQKPTPTPGPITPPPVLRAPSVALSLCVSVLIVNVGCPVSSHP